MDEEPSKTLESKIRYLDRHLQICEVNNRREKKYFEVDSEIGLRVFLPKSLVSHEYLNLSLSVGVYESNNDNLLRACEEVLFEPSASLPQAGITYAETVSFTPLQSSELRCHSFKEIHQERLKKLENSPTSSASSKVSNFHDFKALFEETNPQDEVMACTADLVQISKT